MLESKSRKENHQKLTQLSSRSHPRHLVGKRTAQKDITIDTTSDSQVNTAISQTGGKPAKFHRIELNLIIPDSE